MANDIEFEKLKKEYPDFFKKYSSGFLGFILSEETSSKIAEICLKNKIEDEEKIEKIANRVVSALLGEFPKEKLPQVLEKGIGLNPETAQKIYTEIDQFIFSQTEKTQSIKISSLTPGVAMKLK